jgi:hypothetical protein
MCANGTCRRGAWVPIVQRAVSARRLNALENAGDSKHFANSGLAPMPVDWSNEAHKRMPIATVHD